MKANFINLSTLLLASVLMLSGCSLQSTSKDETATLWVVTEESTADGMNQQAKMIAQRMEESNEGLTVKLDILPADAQKREIPLKQLHNQIMAGKGPDVYLLPTGSTVLADRSYSYDKIEVEPVFMDAVQAMRNGIFADIQELYNADHTLGKSSLKQEIMDAGCLGESRYVLPLRYNIPIIYTTSQAWEELGLGQDSSITALVNAALAQENVSLAASGILMPTDLSLLPQPFDYEKEEILLTAKEIADYMRLYQAWDAVIFENIPNIRDIWVYQIDIDNLRYYILENSYWGKEGYPLFTNTLVECMDTVMITRKENQKLVMLPLQATDGSMVASVTYFGAVGSCCKNKALAYDFLRQFLTEEFQWDLYRQRFYFSRLEQAFPISDKHNCGMVENSWPVRTVGSVAPLWDNRQYQIHDACEVQDSISRGIWFQSKQRLLTDEDIPALEFVIDEVRFPIAQDPENSLEHALSLLNDENGNPTDVDIDALAEQVYLALWWHIGEG